MVATSLTTETAPAAINSPGEYHVRMLKTKALVRFLLAGLIVIGTAAGNFAFPPNEVPHRGSLDDLQSDAVYLLEESDGVERVERLVGTAPSRRRHRIIHIADLHTATIDELAVDLRDQDPDVTYDQIEAEHQAVMTAARRVQRGQRALIRWLAKYHGVDRVYVEGLTNGNLSAYMRLVSVFRNGGADRVPPQLGAVAQALAAGELKDVAPAEDEAAYKHADPFAGDRVAFEGAANDAREAAIVRRLVARGPLSVVVLGGAHDLSRHVEALGDCEYLRVFVEGWPKVEDETKAGRED